MVHKHMRFVITTPSAVALLGGDWGLETSSWSSSRSLDRPTPQRHWICTCQPLESGDRPFYGALVERRDGPRWLRDDDDESHPNNTPDPPPNIRFSFSASSLNAPQPIQTSCRTHIPSHRNFLHHRGRSRVFLFPLCCLCHSYFFGGKCFTV